MVIWRKLLAFPTRAPGKVTASCFTAKRKRKGVFIWPMYFTMGDDQSHPPCLNPAPFLWKDITILQKQPKSIRSILFLFRRMFFKDKTQYVDRVANTNKGVEESLYCIAVHLDPAMDMYTYIPHTNSLYQWLCPHTEIQWPPAQLCLREDRLFEAAQLEVPLRCCNDAPIKIALMKGLQSETNGIPHTEGVKGGRLRHGKAGKGSPLLLILREQTFPNQTRTTTRDPCTSGYVFQPYPMDRPARRKFGFKQNWDFTVQISDNGTEKQKLIPHMPNRGQR
ncbi:hypothetical protein Anapl_16913 [Anas platyrhynchos]|uniref:Uncharacterized protein n=1 Tax=Anas platyrhynchos TaxID=8839 RepID=R0JDN0_ANAPL|nr:hypothetical protein Anapl_16913 [Anas platyrhynchos]